MYVCAPQGLHVTRTVPLFDGLTVVFKDGGLLIFREESTETETVEP